MNPRTTIQVDWHKNRSSAERAKELSNTAFIPTEAPLFKAELITSKQDKCLLFCISHVIFDGWSMNVLMEELSKRYQAKCDQKIYQSELYTMLDYGHWLEKHPEPRQQSMR